MNIINLQFDARGLNGVPCELILYVGKLCKNKDKTYFYIQSNNNDLNDFYFKATTNLLAFYKIKNVFVVNENIPSSTQQTIPIKLNMCFKPNISEKNIQVTPILQKFLSEYEKLFGVLPFYSETNKYMDKYLFINDVILQFGSDIVLH